MPIEGEDNTPLFSWSVPACRSAYAGLALVSCFDTQAWVTTRHEGMQEN